MSGYLRYYKKSSSGKNQISLVKYEGDSASNRPDLFLIDRHSHDFHSLFGHHIKTYVQNLSIIGSLVDNLWRLQACPVKWFSFFKFGCYVNLLFL